LHLPDEPVFTPSHWNKFFSLAFAGERIDEIIFGVGGTNEEVLSTELDSFILD
jgi:hypothetical protein